MTVHPNDKYLLVSGAGGEKLMVFNIMTSDALEANGSEVVSAYWGFSLDIAPNGRFVYQNDPYWRANNSVYDIAILGYSFDPQTGKIAPMMGSPFADNQDPVALAVSPAGNILVVARDNPGHVASYRIDPQTGALSPISGITENSGIPTGWNPGGIVIVPK
ncbi:MAG TPA: beta-propeller fold lactonase family protein [Terriglobales bacterium]|nr:beta-propeller fold lactonase family protein [Terriglobales bacterium]